MSKKVDLDELDHLYCNAGSRVFDNAMDEA